MIDETGLLSFSLFGGVALTNNIITGMLPLTFFFFAYEALYVSDTIA